MTDQYNLDLLGPYSLDGINIQSIFTAEISDKQGIYIWTTPYSHGGYLVTYIGETGVTIGNRIKDHLIQTFGGNYRVCNPDQLIHGNVEIIWDGMWRKGTRDKMPEFIDRAENILPMIIKSVSIEKIFAAELMTTQRIRRRIEGSIAQCIRSAQQPYSSLLPSDIRYSTRKDHENELIVNINHTRIIHGLPKRIIA